MRYILVIGFLGFQSAALNAVHNRQIDPSKDFQKIENCKCGATSVGYSAKSSRRYQCRCVLNPQTKQISLSEINTSACSHKPYICHNKLQCNPCVSESDS